MNSSHRPAFVSSIVLVAMCCTALPAAASVSAGGGFFTAGGNGSSSTGGAVLLSTGAGVPVVPLEFDLSGFVPIASHGGYAVTAEGRFGAGGTAIGAGYGISQFAGGHSGGTATVFLDSKVAPLTSVELRGYIPTFSHGATAGFLGLRFTL
jgi:hypothetical protein